MSAEITAEMADSTPKLTAALTTLTVSEAIRRNNKQQLTRSQHSTFSFSSLYKPSSNTTAMTNMATIAMIMITAATMTLVPPPPPMIPSIATIMDNVATIASSHAMTLLPVSTLQQQQQVFS
uniref:Uncharacterized protein n=1 Tax=Lygus hesperus TaxID=30085 RepID=A0A0K8THJ1_LYGHE